MTDIVNTESTPDAEVRPFDNQAVTLLLRGVGQRTLINADTILSDDQVVLLTRMRDNGSKVCVASLPVPGTDEPNSLNAFLSARLAPGREVTRACDVSKMPRVSKTAAVRSFVGGQIALFAAHQDNKHNFYGVTEQGLQQLAQHETAKRNAARKIALRAAGTDTSA